MHIGRRVALGLVPVYLLLSGCGADDAADGPGGVTVGEARALDEAAEMLDQQRLPAEALEEAGSTALAVPPPAGGAVPASENRAD